MSEEIGKENTLFEGTKPQGKEEGKVPEKQEESFVKITLEEYNNLKSPKNIPKDTTEKDKKDFVQEMIAKKQREDTAVPNRDEIGDFVRTKEELVKAFTFFGDDVKEIISNAEKEAKLNKFTLSQENNKIKRDSIEYLISIHADVIKLEEDKIDFEALKKGDDTKLDYFYRKIKEYAIYKQTKIDKEKEVSQRYSNPQSAVEKREAGFFGHLKTKPQNGGV